MSRPRPAAEQLVTRLADRGEGLTLAESCTGGLVCSLVTDVPGASQVLDRGIVAYTARAKIDELGVDEAVLEDPGPVSQPVTRQMAKGARARADVDWAASVTGIAGPTGGTEATPVGTVFVGVAGRSGATVERYEFEGDRWSTKQRAAEQVIDDLLAGIQV